MRSGNPCQHSDTEENECATSNIMQRHWFSKFLYFVWWSCKDILVLQYKFIPQK